MGVIRAGYFMLREGNLELKLLSTRQTSVLKSGPESAINNLKRAKMREDHV